MVPLAERGPIAALMVREADKAGLFAAGYGLSDLDACDCLALLRHQGEEKRLMALAFLQDSNRPETALLFFAWIRPGTEKDGRELFVETVDEWAIEHGFKRIVAYTRLPAKHIARWEQRYGFTRTGLVEIARTVGE